MHIGASDYIPKSRINVESIKRAIVRSRKACDQARLIDEQRAELETFSYALAHDFKQPIRQIRTFTQLITDQLQGHETQQVREHLAFLGQAALRLGALVDVMSQYTLLNEAPELAQVDLSAVLAGVSDTLAPYIQERRAALDIAQDLPAVYGNAVLMTQVLQNLITNALHYNVSADPKVTISAQTNAEECVVIVSDNGVGIEGKYLTEIFKPLVRLHATAQFAGTGFGLTIARKAILAQHGSIWCESTPGVGSKFYVRLPLSSAPLSPHAEIDLDATP
jgi:light-regulated signal transduction histidine kinase (bacteriophytochrome)